MYSPLHDPASTEKKHKHKKKKKKKKAEKEKRKHAEAAIQVMSVDLLYMCYCVLGYFCHMNLAVYMYAVYIYSVSTQIIVSVLV